jgi:hypothetical protein
MLAAPVERGHTFLRHPYDWRSKLRHRPGKARLLINTVLVAGGCRFLDVSSGASMSYDLFLRSRRGTFDLENFMGYFRTREDYKIDGDQVWYQNADTGVYFSYDVTGPTDHTNTEHFPISLNVNFFRPSYFILEIERELTPLVRDFDLVVFDPQTHGMGEGEYQGDLLISGWNHGNEYAYRTFLDSPDRRRDLACLPRAKLIEIWKWNLGRRVLQEQLGQSKFVPRISFIRLNHEVSSVAIWPDGIPSTIPQVDHLIVPRKELAPKRWLRRVEDRALLAWDDAYPILERNGARLPAGAIQLDYDQPPEEVTHFVESLPTETR